MSATTNRPRTKADAELRTETEIAQAAGTASPGGWWRWSLVALLVLVALLLALQLMGGNRQTDVIPGTPITAPQQNVPVPGAG
jgi:hypothetical protein